MRCRLTLHRRHPAPKSANPARGPTGCTDPRPLFLESTAKSHTPCACEPAVADLSHRCRVLRSIVRCTDKPPSPPDRARARPSLLLPNPSALRMRDDMCQPCPFPAALVEPQASLVLQRIFHAANHSLPPAQSSDRASFHPYRLSVAHASAAFPLREGCDGRRGCLPANSSRATSRNQPLAPQRL